MQATLLSIAIALILALVAALVGPYFIDWNNYRGEFEAQAGRLTGLQVRIAGSIEARLLPTPSLTVQRVTLVRPGEAGALRARRLSVEFALGSLVRGEWKATDVRIEGAEIAVALDRNGRLEWPAPTIGFDPDVLSIERLDISDSRALLADDASGTGIVLERFEFKGELRSLVGAIKGHGSFYQSGRHYPYRIAIGRAGDERGLRTRLTFDPIDRVLTADADGFISIDNGMPRFVGSLTIARPLIRASEGGQDILEPWRLTGKVDGNSRRAVIEQVEFQYGPDERPLKLRGDASLTFGAVPQINAVLSSPQVDLDRILALHAKQSVPPLTALRTFADTIATARHPPIPAHVSVAFEAVTIGGATLQRVQGDFSSTAEGWTIEKLELRAPGSSQIGLSGHVGIGGDGVAYAGRARIEARDARALIAWVGGQSEGKAVGATGLRLDGEFKLSGREIAVEALKLELDRMILTGRLAYGWANGGQPPRIEAAVGAPDIDFDRARALVQGLVADTAFDWPRQGTISAVVGHAILAGVEARKADINLRFDDRGVAIERLAIGDFGGAAVSVKGSLDLSAKAPRGALAIGFEAQRLDGVIALLDRVAPQAASELRQRAGRLAPSTLVVSLDVTDDTPRTRGRFRIAGQAGAFHLTLQGDVRASAEDLTNARWSALRGAGIDLSGSMESSDGNALVSLVGLSRLFAVDNSAGRVRFAASGPLDGDLTVDGRVIAGGLDVAAKGSVRPAGGGGPTAAVALTIANANLRMRAAGGRTPETLPLALAAQASLAEDAIDLRDLKGRVAEAEIGGRLRIGLGQRVSLDGELVLGSLNLAPVIAAAVGAPPRRAGGDWSSEPFEPGVWDDIGGGLSLRFGRVALAAGMTVTDVRAMLTVGAGEFALEEIDGALAGGRLAGRLMLQSGRDGLSVDTHLRIANAKADELLPGGGALSGQATVDLSLKGGGRSPIALIGALTGHGTFTLQDGQLAGADPLAFASVIRSVDHGLAVEALRIAERMEVALAKSALPIPFAQGELAVSSGQLRIANTAVRAKGADLAVRASIDLADGVIDARLALTGTGIPDVADANRPEIAIAIRGPIAAPKRTLDVAAFSNWLSLRVIEARAKRIDALESGKELPLDPAKQSPTASPPADGPPPPREVPPSKPKPKPAARPPAAQAPPIDIRPPVKPLSPPSNLFRP